MKSATDEELVQGCIEGKESHRHELFKRWFVRLGAICRRYSGNDDEAKDLLQESFIKIFDHIKKFRGDSSLSTWMHRVTINHCITQRKKRLKAGWMTSLDGLGEEDDIADQVEEQTEVIDSDTLLDLVRQLPEGYRMVLNLYALEGFSHKEIAAQLEITEGTSKSQLSKARRLLKKMMDEQKMKTTHLKK